MKKILNTLINKLDFSLFIMRFEVIIALIFMGFSDFARGGDLVNLTQHNINVYSVVLLIAGFIWCIMALLESIITLLDIRYSVSVFIYRCLLIGFIPAHILGKLLLLNTPFYFIDGLIFILLPILQWGIATLENLKIDGEYCE